jgi:DNA-binding response OmpR family regulator
MRLLVIEDNVRLASLISKLVADNGLVADVAGGVEEARAALSLVEYDIILLDLSLPDGDGRDILNMVRQSHSDAFVLVVTARGDVVDRVQALNAGADDYLVKPFSDDELVARIRALGRRPHQIKDTVLTAGNVRFDTGSLVLSVAGRPVSLPRRELSVLSVLLSQQGRVLRREKLEKAVYSLDSEVSDNAVEAAVSRLRRKLNAAGATIDIIAMRGIGYVLTEQASC